MAFQDMTKILILATVVVWIFWDVYVYKKKGNIATESWTIKKWSYYAPGIACLLGILLGHFLFTFGTPEALCPQGVFPLPVASPAVIIPLDQTTDGVLIPFKKAN